MTQFSKFAKQACLFSGAILLVTTILLMLPNSAIAQSQDDWRSWPLGEHFTVTVNAFFPSLDTRVRVDASDGALGTTIDFEQDLGMSDTESLPGVGLGWRFAKKHKLALKTFDLDRSGSAITETEIRFGDEVFVVDLPVSSFLDMSITSIYYSYSIIFDRKKELAVDLGVSVQDISFGLIGDTGLGLIEAESALTAPVPTLGLRGAYAFTDKWIGEIGFGVLSLDLAVSDEEELSGEVLSVFASIQHNTFEHVHFGLSYNYYDLRFDWQQDILTNSVGYKYHGPMLSVRAVF